MYMSHFNRFNVNYTSFLTVLIPLNIFTALIRILFTLKYLLQYIENNFKTLQFRQIFKSKNVFSLQKYLESFLNLGKIVIFNFYTYENVHCTFLHKEKTKPTFFALFNKGKSAAEGKWEKVLHHAPPPHGILILKIIHPCPLH